ncbi:hypothetical protein GCM10027194_27140 [Thalassiella azotivora]
MRRELDPEAVAESLHGELGGVVPGAQRLVDAPADGRHVDHPALAALAHPRQDELGQPREADDVHLQLAAGLVHRHVLEGAVRTVARVVHEDVDPSVLGEHALDAGGHRRVVGDVESPDVHAEGGEGLHAVDAPGRGDDREPLVLQLDGGLLADARRGAGDEGDGGCGHGFSSRGQ